MNIFDIFILFINVYCIKANFAETDRVNVGTVLFNAADLGETRWDERTKDLLQARKYFEKIIPSPHHVNTINEEYLDYLLEYINDSYKTIKREVDNPITRNVMRCALSDTIGGNLKVWILPISKYSYYGGTISLKTMEILNEMYNAIKTDLNTDGKGWKKPDEHLLKYVPINIATHRYLKATADKQDSTCEDIAYYEKSKSGFTVPLPVINWNIDPSTMFVPLKNKSLVALHSGDSPHTVVKYYNLIQDCVNNMNNWKDFDTRFQTWLITDVVPHLNDDGLYTPFGGVLSLMNKTRLYGGQFHDRLNAFCSQSPCRSELLNYFTGKKAIVVAILLIEIIWCVPTLLYIMFCQKPKRKFRCGVFCCFKRKLNRNTYYVQSATSDESDTNQGRIQQSNADEHVYKKLDNIHLSFFETKSNQDACDDKYLDALANDEISGKNEVTLNESKPLLLSHNSHKIRSSHHSQYKTENESKSKEMIKTKSGQKHIDRNKSKSSAHIKVSEKIIQNFSYSQFQLLQPQEIRPTAIHPAEEKCNMRMEDLVKKSVVNKSDNFEKTLKIEKSKIGEKTVKKSAETIKVRKSSSRKHSPIKSAGNSESTNNKKTIAKPVKKERISYNKMKQDSSESKKGEKKRNTAQTKNDKADTEKTILQIDIQRSTTELNLGITKTKRSNNTKPSKIPRFSAKSSNIPTETYIVNNKPYIKGIKGSIDDGGLMKVKNNNTKLNVTL